MKKKHQQTGCESALFALDLGGRSDGLFIPPEEIAPALETYYEPAGWDKTTGNPTKEKLTELGLEWIA